MRKRTEWMRKYNRSNALATKWRGGTIIEETGMYPWPKPTGTTAGGV